MTDLLLLGLVVAFALRIRQGPAPGRVPASGLSIALWTVAFGAFLTGCVWMLTGAFHSSPLVLSFLLAVPGPLHPRPRLPGPAALEGRPAALAVGLLSALVVAWVWGFARPVAGVHDEAAYLLQARIFASGRWTAAARPMPEFFEQMHVFVTPFLGAKYPPGHSLLLVPGIWLGWPALVPVLLNGMAGSLFFALVRRLAGAPVALVSWLIWVTAPGTFPYRASYLSENTTTVLWLLSLWALQQWIAKGGRRWVALLALCLGWGAITRPMTMFALALPIGVIFLWRVFARRAWSELGVAAGIGLACLAVLPIWSRGTTGDWRLSPYRYYSRMYFPYDWTGFGARTEPPLRTVPKALEPFARQDQRIHAEHTIGALPDTIARRLQAIAQNQWGGGRESLGLFAVVGLLDFDRVGAFAAISSLALFLAYLSFGNSPAWTAYYLEIQTVLSFATGLGVCGLLASAAQLAASRQTGGGRPRRPAWASAGLATLLVVLSAIAAVQVVEARETRRAELAYQTRFRDRVLRLREAPSIVFVRYAPNHNVHRSLVVNEPDLESTRAWVVHDLGARDAELARLYPERRLYLYDDEHSVFVSLARPGVTGDPRSLLPARGPSVQGRAPSL